MNINSKINTNGLKLDSEKERKKVYDKSIGFKLEKEKKKVGERKRLTDIQTK